MKNFNLKLVNLILLASLFIMSCGNCDDDPPVNESNQQRHVDSVHVHDSYE